MKILLDECVDRRLARHLDPTTTFTVPQMGWAGIKNGDLLTFAESQFDVFITVDRNLSYQQNLSNFGIAMIVLKARSNRYEDLLPFAAPIMAKLDQLENGSFILISLDDPDDL